MFGQSVTQVPIETSSTAFDRTAVVIHGQVSNTDTGVTDTKKEKQTKPYQTKN